MGSFIEGLIAVLGLTAEGMLTITALLTGDAPISEGVADSYADPRTIHPKVERVAA